MYGFIEKTSDLREEKHKIFYSNIVYTIYFFIQNKTLLQRL